ncbi:MAG: hypothetical protein APF80_00555 [Alphaproteobacteria bacterium BRH_c36]|nr:MAG: hypothetical protein APF80_00555 [Alphaproteobacteria bacterium BRH_c36]
MPGTVKQTTGLRLALAATAGLAALASLFMSGDDLLRMQFETAFESRNVAARDLDRGGAKHDHPVAASEDYWLGDLSTSGATPATWNASPQVALGDRVKLTLKGVEQVLEIVAVKTGAGIGGAAAGNASLGKSTLIVTLYPVGTVGKPIHLLLDGEEELLGFVRLSDRPREL